MTSVLSKRDRDNIETLSKIADRIFSGKSGRDGKRIISFNQDQDLLLSNGFEYGVTRASMFGQDRWGNLWQVTTLQGPARKNPGCFAETVWYGVDDRGLRHKRIGGFNFQQFYETFK